MRELEKGIERRVVIVAYAKYDYAKKPGRRIPDFETWDWSRADAIDVQMCRAGLKRGIPAGYLLWDKVELTLADLLLCAVDNSFFGGQERTLGEIERAGRLIERERSWSDRIRHGSAFDESEPFLLRRALQSERGAAWYIEDGSGRAVAFVKNQAQFNPSQTLAVGYLGRKPDPDSTFMQQPTFRELLMCDVSGSA